MERRWAERRRGGEWKGEERREEGRDEGRVLACIPAFSPSDHTEYEKRTGKEKWK